MIFEATTTIIFGVISWKAYLSKNGEGNDSKKINKIFSLSGLNVKDGNQTLTVSPQSNNAYKHLAPPGTMNVSI